MSVARRSRGGRRAPSGGGNWTAPRWQARAHAWIAAQLDRLGMRRTGAIEQPHVQPWSTVMRVPTDAGPLWFKANHPLSAYEPAVVGLLARHRPASVCPLLAADGRAGWMLTGDGGERLREVVERERDLGRWLDVLPRYAELQIDVAGCAADLVGRGVPDRRLARLPVDYEALLGRLECLDAAVRARLAGLAGAVDAMAGRLASWGIPETIQHDDLHDGQVFVDGGSYRFLDWGDSCVSHPFLTMSVTLEGVLAFGLDDVEGSQDVTAFRRAYLEPFRAHAPLDELERALDVALRLGWICRALDSHRLASALAGEAREALLARARVHLAMFLRGMPPR